MEGRLRRTGEQSSVGELHGYRVYVSERGGQWYVWLCPGGEWTEACLRVDSLADAAKREREFIETRGDKRLRKPK
jgi:hypothetical protein